MSKLYLILLLFAASVMKISYMVEYSKHIKHEYPMIYFAL